MTCEKDIPHYAQGTLPEGAPWRRYRKRSQTVATYVEGPFNISTREGSLTLPEGWRGYVALDTHGYPYPIELDEFRNIYQQLPVAEVKKP